MATHKSVTLFLLLSSLFLLPSVFCLGAENITDKKLAQGPKFEYQPPDLGLLSGFDPADLCTVANNSKSYLETYSDDKFAVHAGNKINLHLSEKNVSVKKVSVKKVSVKKVTLTRVKNTLAFICQVVENDLKNNRVSRLTDKKFLTENFEFIRWNPDKKTANSIAAKSTNAVKKRMLNNIPHNKLFLTKYYTKLLDASPVKTKNYTQALYALPYDEKGKTLEQAEQEKSKLTRYKFTRQQIIKGALLNNNLAKPLVWLTEEALHDVLLQGTGVLNVDGKVHYFNVHRNNGIAYDYSMGKREQARYWYFIETPAIMGYGKTQESKIAVKPHVTFAGNVADLGLGKLIMVTYLQNKEQHNKNHQNKHQKNNKAEKQTISRMGIIADQGGAFDNNLFQLDLLVDSYRGWQDYHQDNKHLPDYAQVWIMLVKGGL
ncbi:MAG: MltA domain-containing protein [Alteromonadaceae bacterium]|nr:MltA domain-containing protein [Alteromonadaceae bacterium]